MLRDRYDPMNIFALVPALSFTIEPVLARLDSLLDDDTLFQQVKSDLAKRFPRTEIDGRPSTPVEVILRMLVIKHLHGWSYAQTERWVSDSLVLRQFCRVYLEAVPDDTTLIRWANLIQPATLHQLLDHVVALASRLKVTRGRKLRIDGTVVETNIHHPSASTLLRDKELTFSGVRVISGLLKRAKQVLVGVSGLGREAFRDRTRSARRQVNRIKESSHRRQKQAERMLKQAYSKLLAAAASAVKQAAAVSAALKAEASPAARKLAERLGYFSDLVEQVSNQTRRRVMQEEKVPATEKVVSLFEPHSEILCKGKLGHATQFGRGVWLDEVDGGIISRYEILAGNPVIDSRSGPAWITTWKCSTNRLYC
jgi:IS5 family transposase